MKIHAQLAFGGLFKDFSQFLILLQLSQKMMLASKAVKNDTK
jgi:hypothetical protein